ncbi:MAG: hypothetical protein ACKOY8_11075 [Verrucomicrobiota bacterium]
MKPAFVCLLPVLALADRIVVRDFEGRSVPDAAVRVLIVRRNHPFSDGSQLLMGATDENGCWDFKPGDHHVSRVHVDKAGHHEVRMEGLKVPQTPIREVILPRKGEAVPLHARKADADLPGHVFSGVVPYDFEKGDLVAPGCKGSSPDILVRLSAKQLGWHLTKSPEEIDAFLEKEKDPKARAGFLAVHGKWELTLELLFPHEGDGILESPYAAYASMKLPSKAPVSGYGRTLVLDNKAYAQKDRGFFLRVRTVKDEAGNIVSANYAKIYGTPLLSPGGFAFQYYFNPVPNDRRLEFDTSRNLQRPSKDANVLERIRCDISSP